MFNVLLLAIAAAPLFTLSLKGSCVFKAAPPKKRPIRSDWSATTGVRRPRPPRFSISSAGVTDFYAARESL